MPLRCKCSNNILQVGSKLLMYIVYTPNVSLSRLHILEKWTRRWSKGSVMSCISFSDWWVTKTYWKMWIPCRMFVLFRSANNAALIMGKKNRHRKQRQKLLQIIFIMAKAIFIFWNNHLKFRMCLVDSSLLLLVAKRVAPC